MSEKLERFKVSNKSPKPVLGRKVIFKEDEPVAKQEAQAVFEERRVYFSSAFSEVLEDVSDGEFLDPDDHDMNEIGKSVVEVDLYEDGDESEAMETSDTVKKLEKAIAAMAEGERQHAEAQRAQEKAEATDDENADLELAVMSPEEVVEYKKLA